MIQLARKVAGCITEFLGTLLNIVNSLILS